MRYSVYHSQIAPPPLSPTKSSTWNALPIASVDHYHKRGSAHKPRVEFRALRTDRELVARFVVSDLYVRCLHCEFQNPVYEDSCCELFLKPDDAPGYFNIETNAIGALAVSYITDPTRTADGFRGQVVLAKDAEQRIVRSTSLTGVIDPEIDTPTEYIVEVSVPFDLLSEVSGAKSPRAATTWSGNIYKCSENSSHPHWGAWAPIGERLEFHQPSRFGEFVFV